MSAVFVSYRRGDSEGQARALSLELGEIIGKDSVFMDVDSIALGQDFRAVLHERLASCDLLLALIGPGWLDAKDARGTRRLESPNDYVRQEIAAALRRNIPVTPVLLQGASMPGPERLPEDIQDLVYRAGFELSHTRWESDVTEMVKRLGLRRTQQGADTGPAEAVWPRSGAATGRRYWIAGGIAATLISLSLVLFQARWPIRLLDRSIDGNAAAVDRDDRGRAQASRDKQDTHTEFDGTVDYMVKGKKATTTYHVALDITGATVRGTYLDGQGDKGALHGTIDGDSLDLIIASDRIAGACQLKANLLNGRSILQGIYQCLLDGEHGEFTLRRSKG